SSVRCSRPICPSRADSAFEHLRGSSLARAHRSLERGMHAVVARECKQAPGGAAIGLHALEARERAVRADVEARRAVAVPEHAPELDAAGESGPQPIALGEQLLLERLA